MTDLTHDWIDRLEYVGIVLEDDAQHIWGSSPIWGDDGKVHVFAARIPIASGFDKWWATSHIAHYVADHPEGPYEFVAVLLEPGRAPAGSWDCGTQHNPTITKIDDLFVLSYHSSQGTVDDRKRHTARIGMMTATSINGPWASLGMILETPTHAQVPQVPEEYNGGTDNPALLRRSDGKYLLYYRIKFPGLEGRNTYGVAIADELTGPYHYHPTRVVNNPTYIEDPYVFEHGPTVYMLVTDNERDAGLLMTSTDGLSFDYHRGVPGFGALPDYVSLDRVSPSAYQRGAQLERPQLLLRDGLPTHLFAPGTNTNGGGGTCCHLLRFCEA